MSGREAAGRNPRLLREVGTPDERALLRAAGPPVVEAAVREGILRGLEAALARPGRSRPRVRSLVLASSAILVGGSALAYGLVEMKGRAGVGWPAVPAQPRGPLGPSPASAGSKEGEEGKEGKEGAVSPPETSAPRSAVRPRPAVIAHRGPVPAAQSPRAAPLGQPGLRWPGDLSPLLEPDEEPAGPVPPPPRLIIRRPGRGEASLLLAGGRVVGQAGNTTVSLAISEGGIVGRLGPHPVSLSLHGQRAHGTIAGRPVRFELADIPQGHALRAAALGERPLFFSNTLLEATANHLSWPRSSCKAALEGAAPGVWKGRCDSGGEMLVSLPRAWLALPELPRLIVLSLVLTEREPALRQ